MKKSVLFVVAILAPLSIFSQTEKSVDSKISRVTVFLNKAQVTREVKTRLDQGKADLVISGLSSQIDPQSIQVAGRGSFIIMGTAHRQNFLNEFSRPKALLILQDSVELLQKQAAFEGSQKEVLNREEQMLLVNQKVGGANQNLTVAELKGMADFFRSRLGEIVAARSKIDEKIKRINEKIKKLNQQINEQNDLYSRNTSEIVVSLLVDMATNVELEVNYVVANAGWVPVYDLRGANTKSPVQLNYKANVFQSTGEEWKNIKLVLSTANPTLGGLKPELATQYLDFYVPVVYNYGRGDKGKYRSAPAAAKAEDDVVELNFQVEMEEAGNLSDYVTTVQTSLNVEFDISLSQTVLSSAKPTMVDIRKDDINASYQYSVAPKLDRDAFLLARITGWEAFSLLPGEANIFFEGTFVGKTFIDPNSIRDTLAVSMGRDKRIVVKREKMKDFTTRKAVGANQRDSFAWEISLRNTKNEAVKITVEDQVPVSKTSQIEVTVIDVGGARYRKDTGKLTWELNLNPNETKKVSFKYEVKYPKDRDISGL